MVIAYTTHVRLPEHDLPTHPEHAGRIRAVWRMLDQSGLTARMTNLSTGAMASDEQILAVHTPDYLKLFQRLATLETTARIDADTYVTPTSTEIARLAAGAVLNAVDAVLSGTAQGALSAVRPPGHHAEPGRAMGFCLLNSIAIAARHAQKMYGVDKVLVVDYDVHHGNGTEAAFYEDPSVFFMSIHQGENSFGGAFYPGTGSIDEIGVGKGQGTNLNVPLPPGHGDDSYEALFKQIIIPTARRFKPELVLVSAGFDAHWLDPLAGTRLSLTGYASLTRMLIHLAQERCAGRIVFVMEGGYHLDVLSSGVANIARQLLGDAEVPDPFGPPTRSEPRDVNSIIARLRTLHKL